MGDFTTIRAGLEKTLAAIVGVPTILYENVAKSPMNGTPFIRSTLIPSSSRAAVMGPSPSVLHRGIFLLDVYQPENLGPGAADVQADALLTAFAPGTQIVEDTELIRVLSAERTGGFNEPPWYVVPVTITWYSYIA